MIGGDKTNKENKKSANNLKTWCENNNKKYLLDEWDTEKNYPVTPEDITYGSGKSVWWKCSVCNRSWEAPLRNRTSSNNSGCPSCSKKGTSFAEQAIYFYVKKNYSDAINRYKKEKKELDIYIPSIKTGIEYDSTYFHSKDDSLNRENSKDEYCKANGIRLIRIRSRELPKTHCATIIECDDNNEKALEVAISKLLIFLDENSAVDVNIDRDRMEIQKNYRLRIVENNLRDNYPEIAAEWDYERNGGLRPENFSSFSHAKVWWKCSKCGKSWPSAINGRVSKHVINCAECNAKKAAKNKIKALVKKKGSLLDTHPEVAKEWHPTKNGSLKPSDFIAGSHQEIWWKCAKCGYEWKTPIKSRANGGHGCRKCNQIHTKAIINLDTGEVFQSMIEAAKKYKITSTSTFHRSIKNGVLAVGYHWAYYVSQNKI